MNRILFVDDEQNVLDGIRRTLYSLRNEWDMKFVSSASEALRCLAESPFDALITDVRMPGMSGIELLREVTRIYPQVIRMVLSGTADIELTLQSGSLSHQYLMKPYDAQTLRATVQRALCLRALLCNPALRGLTSQMQSIPSVPAVYGELIQVLRSSEASFGVVGRIMARDVGMTTKILKLANSGYFGVSRAMTEPQEAVVYLGIDTVRALVFTWSAFSQFKLRDCCCFCIEELQQHSLAVGALARKIAKRLSLSPAEVGHAFVGGLLHDIGKLVLVTNYTEQYQEAMRRARASNIPIDQVESEMFGASHAEIGAYLLWLWGLPDPVAEILALHHHPSRDTEVAPAVAAVHFANALVNQESEQEMDLDCLRLKGLEAELPAWRQMRQEMLEGPPS